MNIFKKINDSIRGISLKIHERKVQKAKENGWTPKNSKELQQIYNKYMAEAWEKIEKFNKDGYIPVQGCCFNDFPPYKGVVIYVNNSVPKSTLKAFKKIIENDCVTVEVAGTAYLH